MSTLNATAPQKRKPNENAQRMVPHLSMNRATIGKAKLLHNRQSKPARVVIVFPGPTVGDAKKAIKEQRNILRRQTLGAVADDHFDPLRPMP